MDDWILFALGGYFFLALANVGDKIFVSGFVRDTRVYTVLVGMFGMLVFVAAPWVWRWPGGVVAVAALAGGASFLCALFVFFASLQRGSASTVIPLVGGLVPIATLAFAALLLQSSLSGQEGIAFIFLTAGTFLIARIPDEGSGAGRKRAQWFAVGSAVLFALSFVAAKYVYARTGFWNGFLWMRLGSFAAVCTLFVVQKGLWQAVIRQLGGLFSRKGALFVGNQTLGGVGALFQNAAIARGSVVLVNALQGFQYFFVIGLAWAASKKFSTSLYEGRVPLRVIGEKAGAVALIAAGIAFLAL